MSLDLRGQKVLVTGASSGLGRAIAVQLASRYGAHVLAVARRLDVLDALASEAGGGVIAPIPCDLADPAALQALLGQLEAQPLKAAVLNAGSTLTGPFASQDRAALEALIALNVGSTTALARGVLPQLAQNKGAMMVIASLGGQTPLPFQAVYGASKSYLINFGLALARECRGQGPSVTVCAPGGIATAMTKGSAFDGQRQFMMPPEKVAEIAVQSMRDGKTLVIPGMQNKLMALAIKCLPQPLVTAVLDRQFRKDMT